MQLQKTLVRKVGSLFVKRKFAVRVGGVSKSRGGEFELHLKIRRSALLHHSLQLGVSNKIPIVDDEKQVGHARGFGRGFSPLVLFALLFQVLPDDRVDVARQPQLVLVVGPGFLQLKFPRVQ